MVIGNQVLGKAWEEDNIVSNDNPLVSVEVQGLDCSLSVVFIKPQYEGLDTVSSPVAR